MIPKIRVILETKDFIALSKPAGVLVHLPKVAPGRRPSVSTDTPTVASWIREHYPDIRGVGDNPVERPGIVHRLDKDTSGVLVVARNQPFFEYLKGLFQRHEIKKIYCALVWGRTPKRGVIDKPIGLKPGTVKHSTVVYPERRRGVRRLKMVKSATTEYETVLTKEYDGQEFSLVRLEPKTGRTHQLRVHMASIGYPIVGDTLYSRRRDPWGLDRQFLHAESIEFSAQNGKRVRIAADLPPELERVLSFLHPPSSA